MESKILFNGSSGHDHSGGVNGKPVNLSGSSLATIGVAGLTAGYPVFINGAGTAVETRKIVASDIDLSTVTVGQFIFYNGSDLVSSLINYADLDPSFLLPEAQVTFDPVAGHIHDGVFSAKVPVGNLDVTGLTPLDFLRVDATGSFLETAPVTTTIHRAFGFYYNQVLIGSSATDASWNPYVPENMTAISLSAYCKTAIVGDSLTVTVKIVGGATIATLTITSGNNSGTTSTIASPTLTAGDVLQLDLGTGGGESTSPDGISVVLECTEP